MTSSRLGPEQQGFLERILLQLRSRYPSWRFLPPPEGFSIEADRDRYRVSLSLETLFQRCQLPGATVPEEISRFVAAAGPRLSAASEESAEEGAIADPEAVVWCVRTERTIRAYRRADELVTRKLPAGLLAFVAESLPGEVMRGVSRHSAGEAELTAWADRNTAVLLHQWPEVLADQPGRRRWLFTEDVLFSSSLLLVPEFLAALAERGQGRAALAVPDRGMTVGAVDDGENLQSLRQAVRRLYGVASSPLSPLLLSTDGQQLEQHPGELQRQSRRGWLAFLGSRS